MVLSQDIHVRLISQIDIAMCFIYNISAMSYRYRGWRHSNIITIFECPLGWLQLFEHCLTENHGENRVSSIYHHGSSVNYHTYFLRDIRFFFFCLGFVSLGKERGYSLSSSLPLPPASQIARSSAFVFIREF